MDCKGVATLRGRFMRAPEPYVPEGLDELTLAWMAGVVEGEGSIRINKPNGSRSVHEMRVQIGCTDRELLAPFHDWWRGSLALEKRKDGKKDCWRWVIEGNRAYSFIKAVEPFCVRSQVKQRIALAMEFYEQRAGYRDDPDWLGRQQAYYERMAELNRKGA